MAGNRTSLIKIQEFKAAELRKMLKDHPDTEHRAVQLAIDDLRRDMKKVRRYAPPKITGKADRHMVELSPVDIHIGKLSWREETGFDYDGKIAEDDYVDVIERMLSRVERSGMKVEQFVYPVGNDLLQTDNNAGTTTAGTSVDTDSRYIKSFRRAVRLCRWTIDRLAAIAPVRVPVVPGNHDRLTAFHVGDVLNAVYESSPHVDVLTSPKLRTYVTYGPTLLGFTHGSEEKLQDLPLIMSVEAPEWSKSKWREWHIGHFHKSKEVRYTAGDSFNGVRVRVLPSLCAADAWHYMLGYVGEQRACEAYLWNKRTGYAGHFSESAA